MILNSTPENEAIVSNVGQIGEFRIRNSAKAFGILSSGLYANKIRAVIRELACNAVDAHVAAGTEATPFEIHLPNSIEPYFSIRDYGIGLTQAQVESIYTTYFESTKTDSNSFIGALGLGSKSPFSYTDNFSVTAVKDGIRGVYSAFINGEGVPSIALMMSEETTDANGVEIKMSVNAAADYHKFREEATIILARFNPQPLIRGCSNFQVKEIDYDEKDIVPGVSTFVQSRYSRLKSVAVMGNIEYPIEVPNADQVLGTYAGMLDCGLELKFDIGELDFQASREGLSYIPSTIESIRAKLEKVSASLADVLETQMAAVPTHWERAVVLKAKHRQTLWRSAVYTYIGKNPHALYGKLPTLSSRGGLFPSVNVSVGSLAAMNITLRAFRTSGSGGPVSNFVNETTYSPNGPALGPALIAMEVLVEERTRFVITDTKTGALERAKYSFRLLDKAHNVYVLSKLNTAKEMDLAAFFAAVQNPPKTMVLAASSLTAKPRKVSAVISGNTLMRLQMRRKSTYSSMEPMWCENTNFAALTHVSPKFYIPMKGYVVQSKHGYTEAKALYEQFLSVVSSLDVQAHTPEVYGLRGDDIAIAEAKGDWLNVEDYIVSLLTDKARVLPLVARAALWHARHNAVDVDASVAKLITSKNSLYRSVSNDYAAWGKPRAFGNDFMFIAKSFLGEDNFIQTEFARLVEVFSAVDKKYPMLRFMISGFDDEAAVKAEYISMVDSFTSV